MTITLKEGAGTLVSHSGRDPCFGICNRDVGMAQQVVTDSWLVYCDEIRRIEALEWGLRMGSLFSDTFISHVTSRV